MLPAIGLVHSVEMIRDGGSLAATFQGSDCCDYWLFLEVQIRKHPSGEWERLGYADPVIIDRLIGTSTPINWQHAQIFLKQIRSMVFAERDVKWLECMEMVIATHGQVPPSIDRFLR